MWFQSMLNSIEFGSAGTSAGRARRAAPRKRPATCTLLLELLEDRTVPSFLPAVTYPVNGAVAAMAVGDFNNDGKLDIVAVNAGGVSVLLGNGDGTFQTARSFANSPLNSPPGQDPARSVAVGDFNGDGKLDILTGNAYDLGILLGNGDGTFQPAQSIYLPYFQNPISVAVGDLNNDGKLDIVVAGATPGSNPYDPWYFPYQPYLNVLLGNGDGTFTTASTTTVTGAGQVALADFNGDRKLDVAMTGYPTGSVWLGNGDGTLQAPLSFAFDPADTSMAVGDFNGDGKPDIVMSNDSGTVGTVRVLLGNGDGTFQAAQSSAAGYGPSGLAIGDFNHDGKPDLAVTSPYSRNVSVLLGNGNGTFQSPLGYAADLLGPIPVAVGDFNGDGFPDLAVGDASASTLSVLINAADWSTLNSFAVSGFLSPTTAGASATFTVAANDGFASTLTGYTGTVHFSSSDPQAVLPADYTFTAADKGVHIFTATLKTVAFFGTQVITAADTVKASATGSEDIMVNPAAVSHLVVTPWDKTEPAGTPFSVTVWARDSYNNITPGYTGTIRFTSSDPAAVLPADYTFTATDRGGHLFYNGVTLKSAGGQTVTASDTVTPSITGSGAVIVNPAVASTLAVAGFPSPTTAGASGSFTVTAKTSYGATATNYTGTVHVTSSDGKALLPANYTFTAADGGVHTFSATLKTAGTQSITVKDTTTASITGTDAGITVDPAAASKFLISAPASVSSGVAFSLTIAVQDAYGNVVTGYTGTIHFWSTDGTATLPANYTFIAADNGVHTFSHLKLRKRGSQTITVTDTLNNSLTGSVIENVL